MMKLSSAKINAIILCLVVGFASSSFGQTTNWKVTSGDWFVSTNWDNGLPNLTTNAQINNGGTSQIMSGSAIADYVALGFNGSDSGTLSVSGAGTMLTTNNRSLEVGGDGTGTVNITSGAVVTNNFGADSFIGDGGTGVGTVTVSGTGSMWTNTGNLSVGRGGNGTLHISGGATVSNTGITDGIVANFAYSTGLVTVDGTGSTWALSGTLTVGNRGTGTLTITSGGKVTNISQGIIGAYVTTLGVPSPTTAVGTLNVDGANSIWMNTGDSVVGLFGRGTMNVTNGGTVSSGDGYIAGAPFAGGSPGSGAVTVDGMGSNWTNTTGDLNVGFRGTGTLSITNGGAVSDDNGTLGHDTGTNGMVTVDGAGSSWTNTGTLSIGLDGNGSLNITDGASVAVSGSYVRIAEEQSSVSSVTVDGVGSSLTIAHELDVARAGTGMLTIRNGGSVTMTGSDRAAIGVDSGSNGTVIVDGAGSTWNVPTNIYVGGDSGGAGGTGLLRVTNGAAVNAANVFVQSTGTLAGNGEIAGNVSNSGFVSPGTSPGKLTINGNYAQTSTGSLQTELGGLNAGVDSDLLSITGTAALDGNLNLIKIAGFRPPNGSSVTILTAGGGVSGTTFSSVTSTFGGSIQPSVIYNSNDVEIQFNLTSSFMSHAVTPNQKSVAGELDQVASDPRAANLIAFIGNEPPENLPHDYDLIAPEEFASIYESGFSQATQQGVNLMQRMDDIRAGSNGFCAAGYAPQITQSLSKDSDGKVVMDKNPAPAFVPAADNRWGIWVTGSGQYVDVGNRDESYAIANGAATVGIDYRLLHNLAIGIYGGYDAGKAILDENGQVKMDGGDIGGFATWFWGGFYVDASGGGTWNDYDTRRAALDGDALGSTHSSQYNVLGAIGYDWRVGCLNIGPRATVQYLDMTIDHFGERGSVSPLEFPDQSEDSLQSTVGMRASYDIHTGTKNNAILRPELSVAWLHEYNDATYPIDSRLASGAGNIFTVWGPTIGRDAAQIRAGFSVQVNAAFSVYAYYDGVVGRGNYDNNGGSAGFSWSF